ncbi:hypothetical protein ACHAP5_001115 [Fusarium lateritium]
MARRRHSGPKNPPGHSGLKTPPARDEQRRDRRCSPFQTKSSVGVLVDDNEEIHDVIYVSSEPEDFKEHKSPACGGLTPVSKEDGKKVQGATIELADDDNNDSVSPNASATVVESTDDDTVDNFPYTSVELFEPEPSEASFQGNENTEDGVGHGASNGPIVNTSRFFDDSTDPSTIPGTAQYNFSLDHGSANHSGHHDRTIDYTDWEWQRTSDRCFQCEGEFDPEEENNVNYLLSFYENRYNET